MVQRQKLAKLYIVALFFSILAAVLAYSLSETVRMAGWDLYGSANYICNKEFKTTHKKTVNLLKIDTNTELTANLTLAATNTSKKTTDYENLVYSTCRDEIQASRDEYYEGYFGRFNIPLLYIDVGVSLIHSQRTVDIEDLAEWYMWGDGTTVVVDHASQEFKNLGYIKPGMTAILYRADGSKEPYVCTKVFSGFNDGHNIYDTEGKLASNPGGLLAYTCQSTTGYPIWIVYFDKVITEDSDVIAPQATIAK